jgi:hypothetical protein
MDPGRFVSKSGCLGKRNRRGEANWGRGRGRNLRRPNLPTVPGRDKLWVTREWDLRLASRSVFAWLNCGVTSQSSQFVTVWAGDPEANPSRSLVAMPKSSASLRCRISNTHPVAGGCRLHKMLAGKGAKGSAVVARPQRRMQAI